MCALPSQSTDWEGSKLSMIWQRPVFHREDSTPEFRRVPRPVSHGTHRILSHELGGSDNHGDGAAVAG
jgi:hypothetical protein